MNALPDTTERETCKVSRFFGEISGGCLWMPDTGEVIDAGNIEAQ